MQTPPMIISRKPAQVEADIEVDQTLADPRNTASAKDVQRMAYVKRGLKLG